ncbi:hypothetical protein [Lysinibacillus fusiformis]|uniref:hypothetical protein n=1 Tax=Lysinibacillus fusiformis TaxID=28031 RepID=UPI0021BE53BD|nr:hypothetical protein [Lysinibacillus fusiformis]UXJ67592.1 hypothetical protein N5069_15615 [Lysinibacillus fusiformis]
MATLSRVGAIARKLGITWGGDWTGNTVEGNTTKPIAKDDDKMLFTNETTKAAVRDYIKQSVDKKKIDKSWLEKFDNGTMTSGDFEGLKIIISQRSA